MISDARLGHLASIIIDGIWKDDVVEYSDEEFAVRTARKAASNFGQQLKDIDAYARQRVASLKRGVVEGSPEWDVLYRKYFEEEMSRKDAN